MRLYLQSHIQTRKWQRSGGPTEDAVEAAVVVSDVAELEAATTRQQHLKAEPEPSLAIQMVHQKDPVKCTEGGGNPVIFVQNP